MSDRSNHLRALKQAVLLCMAWVGVFNVSALVGQGPLGAEKASFSIVPSKTAFEPGEEASLAAVMDIERDWHTNSNQPTFEYLIPTKIAIGLPDGWPLPDVYKNTREFGPLFDVRVQAA